MWPNTRVDSDSCEKNIQEHVSENVVAIIFGTSFVVVAGIFSLILTV